MGRGQPGAAPLVARHGRSATWMLLTASWRTRWRGLLVIAVMVGLTAGCCLAAVAGARRSASSLARFHDSAQTLDVFVAGDEADPPALDGLLDGPLVEDHKDLLFIFADIEGTGSYWFAPLDGGGSQIERGVLLAGRRADPKNPDEIVLAQGAAQHLGLGPGDTLDLATFSPAQAEAAFAGTAQPTAPDGPTVHLHVVGVVRNGFDLRARPGDPAMTFLTPAFLLRYGDQVGHGTESHMVRLVDGPRGVGPFTDGIARVFAGRALPSLNLAVGAETVADSISIITAALLVMALVIAVAGFVWIVAVAGRHLRHAASDLEVLRALGATPGERRLLLLGMVAPGLALGLILTPLIAIALSPFLPVGLARQVDPDPGRHADLAVLVLGSLVLLTLLAGAVAVVARRIVDRSARREGGTFRVPVLVDRAARWFAPVPSTGVRFALLSPRNVSAPVRSALVGAGVGVMGLAAVAVVGSSLQRFVDTPARWGTTWDVAVGSDNVDREALLGNSDISAAALALFDEQVSVAGHESISVVIDPVKGEIGPAIIEGRAPRADDEVAVGRDTLHAIDLHVGDTVEVGGRSQTRESFRIVGVAAFPTVEEPSPLADGATFTAQGGQRLLLGDPNRDDAGYRRLLIRWAPGVDRRAALARLGDRGQVSNRPIAPPEVQGLDDVKGFPVVAAGALIVLGVIATSHALVVTVQRRRRELGVLGSLGFAPRQRGAVISVQATAIAVVALLLGLPLGAATGRVVWSSIAGSMGVATDVVVPLPALVSGTIVFVVLLNLVAALPAWSARRLRVANALRSE